MPGDSDKLPSPLSGFGEREEQRKAALAAYREQLGSADFGELEDAPELEDEPGSSAEPQSGRDEDELEDGIPSLVNTELSGPANLEPIGDEAHPPQNRRMPTQPPQVLALDLGDDEPRAPTASTRDDPSSAPPVKQSAPTYRRPGSRPSPAPLRRGLFAVDRATNLLVSGAIGLFVMIIPAKKVAESYETREVEPLIAELEASIERPLGVEAGVVEDPESLATKLDAGRRKIRLRYTLIWLLGGLPIGVALGLIPRS